MVLNYIRSPWMEVNEGKWRELGINEGKWYLKIFRLK
jgi:hypothetical protein